MGQGCGPSVCLPYIAIEGAAWNAGGSSTLMRKMNYGECSMIPAAAPVAAPPTRTLDKQEAIRHLIHCAVRLLMIGEDPFVIHMLAQSADKLLADISKHSGRPHAFDLTEFIKPDKLSFFFDKYRATYNYFKHADRDFDKDLPVNDITRGNVVILFVVVQNYHAQFGSYTDHMFLLNMFVQAVMPGIFQMDEVRAAEYKKLLDGISTITPKEFFATVYQNTKLYAPRFKDEDAEDRQDGTKFYNTKFAELHEQDARIGQPSR
jgi:hypothetical protein